MLLRCFRKVFYLLHPVSRLRTSVFISFPLYKFITLSLCIFEPLPLWTFEGLKKSGVGRQNAVFSMRTFSIKSQECKKNVFLFFWKSCKLQTINNKPKTYCLLKDWRKKLPTAYCIMLTALCFFATLNLWWIKEVGNWKTEFSVQCSVSVHFQSRVRSQESRMQKKSILILLKIL